MVQTPIEACFGDTPDLSPLLQFTFYKPVYFLDQDARFPETRERLGRFVGIAENHGDTLTYWILTPDDQLLARSVVCKPPLPRTPTNRRLHPLSPRGVLNLLNPTQGARGVQRSISVPLRWT